MRSATSSNFLYRIVRFERLVQLLKTDEWHFAHPSTWEDPYEIRTVNPLSSSLFAQCWCRKGVSDAMWRIYSSDKLGVRIRTTATSLNEALTLATLRRKLGHRMNKVSYVTERQYAERIAVINASLAKRVTFARASQHLFLKRVAFEHEAETRVVVFDLDQPLESTVKFVKVQLPTRDLIDSVLVDPRAPDEYVEMYQDYLARTLHFAGKVEKSSLYRSSGLRES
jgi:hypothetical protein